jgi:ribosomal-protein-alanine N-acetyltransferase
MINRRSRIFVEEIGGGESPVLAEVHGSAFARTWSEHEFASLLSDRTVFALGLRYQPLFGGRRLLGFVLVRIVLDEAEILTVVVKKEHRGRGYGRMLMEEALRRLYRSAVATCFLEVADDNEVAVTLYRSLGFAEAGERKGYYGDSGGAGRSALVMRLQLRQDKGRTVTGRAER